MNEAQAEEFKLLETHGQMKNGSAKKIEYLSSLTSGGKCDSIASVYGLTVHICGVI